MKMVLGLVLSGCVATGAAATDARTPVELPPHMHAHMLANMRDHLAAVAEVQGLAAAGQWDAAADVLERRVGMSSLPSHGAAHMTPLMPPEMQDLGTAMHRTASRVARTLQEADPVAALAGLSELLGRCNACHAAFRLK